MKVPKGLSSTSRRLWRLVIGHKISRTEDLARGWTIDQINDLSNTQSECWLCSITSGGTESVQARRAAPIPPRVPLSAPEASNW